MKVYLAGSWSRKDEFNAYKDILIENNISVTSRWLVTHNGEVAPPIAAIEDLEDIARADYVVSFTEDPPHSYESIEVLPHRYAGGRHVEFGYATALGKGRIVVGPLENVFHHLPDVEAFSKFEDALTYLIALNLIIKVG